MILAPTTAAAGTCEACSSLLAPGQRYCVVCGERRGELPFRVPERGEEPAGRRRPFAAVSVIVLASGVLIGATIGPAITPASLASTAGDLVVVASGGAPRTSAPAAPPSTSLAAVPTLSAPTGDVAKPPPVVINRGGGGSAAPAQAPPPPAPRAPQAPAKAAPPPPAPPPTVAPEPDPIVTGTVVHLSPDGKRYAIATKDGQLLVLHADKQPALGDNLKLTVHALDDGTFDQKATKSLGTATTASFNGIVTFADPQAGTYTVSARGVSMLVHLPPSLDPTLPPLQPPALGIQTTVQAGLVPQLQEIKRTDGQPNTGEFDLTAIVRDPGPTPDPAKLIVSADDAGESPSTLTLTIPPKLDVSKLSKPDTAVEAVVKREADGSLTLVSASAA